MKKLLTILMIFVSTVGIAKPFILGSRTNSLPVIIGTRTNSEPFIIHGDYFTDYNRRVEISPYPISVFVYNNKVYITKGYGGAGGYVDRYDLALTTEEFSISTGTSNAAGLFIYNDKIYITDFYSSGIGVKRFDLDMTNGVVIIARGTAQGEVYRAQGIYIKDDIIYVVDTLWPSVGARLQSFDLDGTFRSMLVNDYGSGDGELNNSTGVDIYNDEIYITDRGNHRIQVFNMSGIYQRQWGSYGSSDGQFGEPKQSRFYDGYCYVSQESNSGKIQVFNSTGVFQTSFIPTDSTQTYGLWVYEEELFITSQGGYVGIVVYD